MAVKIDGYFLNIKDVDRFQARFGSLDNIVKNFKKYVAEHKTKRTIESFDLTPLDCTSWLFWDFLENESKNYTSFFMEEISNPQERSGYFARSVLAYVISIAEHNYGIKNLYNYLSEAIKCCFDKGIYMNEDSMKVKVVPKSKYTREDIEKALDEAYEDYSYILDFMKETDEYIVLYLKEKEI